jgi:hypothetical protein
MLNHIEQQRSFSFTVMKWINNPIWKKPDRVQAINASKEFIFAVKLENLKFDEGMLKALLGKRGKP